MGNAEVEGGIGPVCYPFEIAAPGANEGIYDEYDVLCLIFSQFVICSEGKRDI